VSDIEIIDHLETFPVPYCIVYTYMNWNVEVYRIHRDDDVTNIIEVGAESMYGIQTLMLLWLIGLVRLGISLHPPPLTPKNVR
jgi:hypothetical protein